MRLISIACVSPEASAPSTAPLRRRFVESLLERGLLKVMADLAGDYDNNFLREVGGGCSCDVGGGGVGGRKGHLLMKGGVFLWHRAQLGE